MKKWRIKKIHLGRETTLILRKMKLTVLFSLLLYLTGLGNTLSQSTKLSLDLQDVPIKEFIRHIEDQTEFYFIYQDDVFSEHQKVTIRARKESLESVIQKMAKQTSVEFKIFDRQIVIIKKEKSQQMISARPAPIDIPEISQPERKIITGTVTDEQGIALPGVSIMVKGSTIGTITDLSGQFELTIPLNAQILIFSFMGMEAQEIEIGEMTIFNVSLLDAEVGLDEVVVIGYGTQSRRLLTSAISSLSGESIESIPVSNTISALQGKIAGVNIYHQNFAPGETPSIRIRGGSSISYSNAPLIIIDGLPRSMDEINPNDIESIDILKDAASTAVYGARGSNGVILITTKRGKVRKAPEIIFESNISHQEYHKGHPLLNGEEFINLIRTNIVGTPFEYTIFQDGPASHTNNNQSVFTPRWLGEGETVPSGWQSMPDPIFPGKTIVFQENDPVDLLFKTGIWQNHYLGVRGGADNIRYAAGIGYTADDGVVVETGWKRISGLSNADIDITDKITFSTGIDYTITQANTEPSWATAINRQLIMPPTWRIFYDDGSPVPGFNANATPPPFWRATRDYYEYNSKLGLNSSLIYKPLSGLILRANAFYYRSEFEDEYFEKSHFFAQNRNAYTNQNLYQTRQLEGIATYTKTIAEKHNLSFMSGFSDLFFFDRTLYINADGAATDNIPTLNAAPNKKNATTSKSEESLIGLFGRLSYNFSDKYLLQGSIRRDGSSKFGNERKWGYFPAVSVGWILSEEPFMKGFDVVNNLKLRTSYGLTGNNAIGRYLAQGSYAVNRYAGKAAIITGSMPNQNLGWEKTKQFDIGYDLAILNQRITILFDYYTKITEDLLFSKPLPNTSSYSSITTNYGSVKFWGYDIDVSAKIINSTDFKWDARFIYNLNKNVVLKLPDNGRDKNRIGGIVDPAGGAFGGTAEGESLYAMLGYKVDFIIDNQEQADSAHYDLLARGFLGTVAQQGRKFPGDYEWIDRNGDGRINDYDRFILGYTMPHSTGGFGNTFSWKGLELDIFLDYAIGHSVQDEMLRRYNGNDFVARVRPTKFMLTDAWEKEGDAATKYFAKFWVQDQGNQNNLYRLNDRHVFRADFLCLREIKLSFQLPESWISKIGFTRVNAYLTGNNLHYFTKSSFMKYINPEFGTISNFGADYGYPPIRRINVGLKVTL